MPLYGLIGYPLTHSYSQQFFTEKFKKQGLKNFEYRNFEINNSDELLNLMQTHNDLCGLNITIPYKKAVLEYLDEVDDLANAVGAVNVITITTKNFNKVLKGFNTDVIGFEKSITPYLKPHHKKALILGTGGAANAVVYVLKKSGIPFLHVTRTKKQDCIIYADINEEVLKEHTIIINATPVGMYPDVNNAPPLPYQFLTKHHLLFDLIYNPKETMFMQKGKEQKATVVNGAEMLRIQAEKAFDIFMNQWK